MEPRRRALTAAAVTLVVSTVALVAGNWYLACNDGSGHALGGIDCLGRDVVPESDTPLVGAFGFVPLVILWIVSALVLVATLLRLPPGRGEG
jgi:hypothetical protein